MVTRMSATYVALLTGLTLTCGACGSGTSPDEAAETTSPDTVVLERGTRLASIDSTHDIAEWASYVLRVEVTGESERNASPQAPGEELVGRDVAVLVEEVVWAHPAAVTDVNTGEPLTIYTFPGYVRAGGQLTPAVEEGDTRLEVGSDYVVVMADDLDLGGGQILTLLDGYAAGDDPPTLADGTPLESTALAEDEQLAGGSGGDGPRPGESLVERLERYTEGE